MAGKLVITTGTSCCGRKETFLPSFEEQYKERIKIKIYNVGDMIIEWAWENVREKLPRKNILYVNKLAMNLVQGGVWKDIRNSLKSDLKNYDLVIINLHNRFPWWKGSIYLPVHNAFFIKKMIESGFTPDMFICFIDNADDISKRLKENEQWKSENLSEKDIWIWQNEEVNITKEFPLLSENDIKFFVMPIRQPPETLYCLLFEPWRPVVYIQMPLSHIKVIELKKVVWLLGELRKWAVVFDPMTIETGLVELKELEKADDNAEIIVRHTQTGYRDTEWFIPQVDVALAYYVKLVLTLGLVDETATAAGLGKQTWAIFPTNASPFLVFRVPPERIFKNPEECLVAFKTYAEELEKIYKEQKNEAQSAT